MRYRLYALLVVAVLVVAGTSDAASTVKAKAKPKPPAKTVSAGAFKPTLQKAFTDSLLRFHRRTIVEAYAQCGTHDPTWDNKVAVFLDNYVRVTAKVENAPPVPTLVGQAKEILGLGCTDPLVISLCGIALSMVDSEEQAQPLLEKSLIELPKSKYCKWRAAVIPHYLICINNKQGTLTPQALRSVATQQTSLIAQSLRDGSYMPGESRVQLWNLMSIVDKEYRAVVAAEIAKNPKVDRYVINCFRGALEIDTGSAHRGTGWASEVTAEGWKGFEEHLTVARKLLTEAWKLHPGFPEAPCLMVTVTMAGFGNPGDTPRLWFGRATAAQYDYMPAYSTLRWALRPRWGGSLGELHAYGVKCLQAKRFDTEVPWEFFQTLRDITSDLEGKKTYWLKPETGQYLETLYDGYAKAKPNNQDRMRTFRAVTAWYVGDCKKAKALLDELGNRGDNTVFTECFSTTPEYVRTETTALGGEYGSRLQTAAASYRSGRLAESVAEYDAIRADAKDDSAVIQYARDTSAPITIENAFLKNGWADLRASTDLVEWRTRGKGWSAEPDGTIVLTPLKADVPQLLSRASFGTQFEIRGQVEFGSELQCAVVVFRHPSRLILASLDRANDEIAVVEGWTNDLQRTGPAGLGDKNDFLVRYQDGRVSISANGKLLIKDFDADKYYYQEKLEVGVGAYVFEDDAAIKFRNLQIRRLAEEP